MSPLALVAPYLISLILPDRKDERQHRFSRHEGRVRSLVSIVSALIRRFFRPDRSSRAFNKRSRAVSGFQLTDSSMSREGEWMKTQLPPRLLPVLYFGV